MKPRRHFSLRRRSGLALVSAVLLLGPGGLAAQVADFKIVWVVVGEAASSAGDQPAQAGRRLFSAGDIANLSLQEVKVVRVDVMPTVTAMRVGDRFCLSSLRIAASAPGGALVKRAPLSVSVRQDHREAMHLDRSNRDICVEPDAAGEYPVRFGSLLPAADGSMRGAQIFIRVSAADAVSAPPAESSNSATR